MEKIVTSKASKQSLIEYPCDFPVKAIGKAENPIAKILETIVSRHSPHMEHIDNKFNQSRNQQFIAVTVVVKALNQQQLDNIYQELVDHRDILMAL